MSKKLTYEYVKKYVEENGNGDILLSKTYERNSIPLDILCSKCGRTYTSSWSMFSIGGRCRHCSMQNLWDNSRANKDDVVRKLENGGFIVIGEFEYKNNLSKVNLQDKDGYKYNVSVDGAYKSIKENFSLNKVNRSNPFSIENINLWIEKTNHPCKVIGGTYDKYTEKTLEMECFNGHFYKTSLAILYGSDTACLVCSGRLITFENNFTLIAPALLSEWSYANNIKKPEEFGKGSHVKVWWVCKNGYNDYLCSVPNKIMGRGCPMCASEQTESRVASYLKNYCVGKFGIEDAIPEYRLVKNPKTNYYLRNDIYIISLQLHIEVMGEQHYRLCPHFHKTNEVFEYQKYKDDVKRDEVKKLNHNYLEIDIKNKKSFQEYEDILTNYIKDISGKEVYA